MPMEAEWGLEHAQGHMNARGTPWIAGERGIGPHDNQQDIYLPGMMRLHSPHETLQSFQSVLDCWLVLEQLHSQSPVPRHPLIISVMAVMLVRHP